MDSIQPCTASVSLSGLTNKQRNCLDALNLAISATEIERIAINEPFPIPQDKMVAVDVEYNESGGFVGCGLYFGTGIVYYYSSLLHLHSIDFQSLAIIAHNGVSDIEILNEWGIYVDYRNLVWDTMLMGHIIDSSLKDYGLKGMAKRELGVSYPRMTILSGDVILKRKGYSSTNNLWN